MGYDFVLLISTVIPLVAVAPFALWVNDPPKDEQAYEADYFDNLKAGIAEAGANRTVLYILLTYSTLSSRTGCTKNLSRRFSSRKASH